MVEPAVDGATEIRVTTKRPRSFYESSVCSFLRGVEAKPAGENTAAVDAKPAVESLRVSGLGDAVPVAIASAQRAEAEGLGCIIKIQTAYPQQDGSGKCCAQVVIDIKKGRAMRKFDEIPLHIAGRAGDVAEVERLLKDGADISEKDSNQQLLAIHMACSGAGDHVDAVKVLLDADPETLNQGCCMDITPLIFAATAGNLNICKMLLEAKADLRAQSCMGDTAVSCAAGGGHDAIVNFLQSAG